MKIVVKDDYRKMSSTAADILMSAMFDKERRHNICITAGKTPTMMYEILVDRLRDKDLSNVHFYNFDEIPVKGREFGITMTNLNRMFYDKINIHKENIHIYDVSNYENYDEKIKDDGGLDLIIMGIGLDGHFCGNLRGTLKSFDVGSHLVYVKDCEEEARERIANMSSPELMEPYYVTFGPRTVMDTKKVIVIANGKNKADIVSKAVNSPKDLKIPITSINDHRDLTFLLDKEAASKL